MVEAQLLHLPVAKLRNGPSQFQVLGEGEGERGRGGEGERERGRGGEGERGRGGEGEGERGRGGEERERGEK